MHHADPAFGAQVDLAVGELGHVHGDQAVVDQAEAVEARDRALAVLLLRLLHFLRGLVQVQVHRQVELVGEHADAFEIGVTDGIGRVRRERGRDQRIVAPLVVDLAGAVEVFVVRTRPRGREIDHRQADAGAEAVALVGRGLHVGEEVVLVGAGGAAAQHLGDGQRGAVGDEFRADQRRLDRPDVFLQPDLQRQIVGDAAQQRHRIVRMGVDQPGDQHGLRPRHGLGRREARTRLGRRQHRDDRAAAHGDGVILAHHAVRFDRHQEAGFDQQVAGFGSHGTFAHAALSHPVPPFAAPGRRRDRSRRAPQATPGEACGVRSGMPHSRHGGP